MTTVYPIRRTYTGNCPHNALNILDPHQLSSRPGSSEVKGLGKRKVRCSTLGKSKGFSPRVSTVLSVWNYSYKKSRKKSPWALFIFYNKL